MFSKGCKELTWLNIKRRVLLRQQRIGISDNRTRNPTARLRVKFEAEAEYVYSKLCLEICSAVVGLI